MMKTPTHKWYDEMMKKQKQKKNQKQIWWKACIFAYKCVQMIELKPSWAKEMGDEMSFRNPFVERKKKKKNEK